MPRKKKHPTELTTDEAIGKLFPKAVVKHAKKHASGAEKPLVKGSNRSIKGKSSG
jgi:hypothetical protein